MLPMENRLRRFGLGGEEGSTRGTPSELEDGVHGSHGSAEEDGATLDGLLLDRPLSEELVDGVALVAETRDRPEGGGEGTKSSEGVLALGDSLDCGGNRRLRLLCFRASGRVGSISGGRSSRVMEMGAGDFALVMSADARYRDRGRTVLVWSHFLALAAC